MNAKSLFAAAAIAFVGTAAFAQDVQNHPTPSTLTRAQVQAELASYAGRPSSQVEVFGSNKQAVAAVRDGKVSANATRLARVEVRRDLAAGDNAATIVGEAYGSVVAGTGTSLSREAVRAEAVAAMRHRSVGQAGD
jgi:hypothetical protein